MKSYDYIQLQGIGKVGAIKVEDLQPNMKICWNYAYGESIVVKIEQTSKLFYTLTTKHLKDGIEYSRRKKIGSLVGVATNDNDEIEFMEAENENIQTEKQFSDYTIKTVEEMKETLKDLQWTIQEFQFNENDSCIYAVIKNKYNIVKTEGMYAPSYDKKEIPEMIECIKYNFSNIKFTNVSEVTETVTKQINENAKVENEVKAGVKETEAPQSQENNINVTVSFNHEKNGIELLFTDKPSDEIRSQIKNHRFRWSKPQGIWYSKDTEENRKFLQEIGFLNGEITGGNSTTSIVAENKKQEISYPEININDIETYTIDTELSKRENDNTMFRSKEINHTKEIQDILQSANDDVIELINLGYDQQIEYKAKTYLQSFKKKYYELYKKVLNHKASNPSWCVTGRSGLNVNRYNKKQEQLTNMMKQLNQLINDFNRKINTFKRNMNKAM